MGHWQYAEPQFVTMQKDMTEADKAEFRRKNPGKKVPEKMFLGRIIQGAIRHSSDPDRFWKITGTYRAEGKESLAQKRTWDEELAGVEPVLVGQGWHFSITDPPTKEPVYGPGRNKVQIGWKDRAGKSTGRLTLSLFKAALARQFGQEVADKMTMMVAIRMQEDQATRDEAQAKREAKLAAKAG